MRNTAIPIIVGLYQIIAGALGVFNALHTATTRGLGDGTLWILAGPIIVGTLSIVCGVLLMKRSTAAPRWSLLVQYSQVVGLGMGSFAYALGLGLAVHVSYGNPPSLIERTSTYFILDVGSGEYLPFAVINLVPLVAIIGLKTLRVGSPDKKAVQSETNDIA